MRAGQRFQDSLILRRLPHPFDCIKRAGWELLRHGLIGYNKAQFHHVLLYPRQENLFLVYPARFLPLLRHVIFKVGLRVCATSMLRDPRLATELTTAVRAW